VFINALVVIVFLASFAYFQRNKKRQLCCPFDCSQCSVSWLGSNFGSK
jgi:hypothetical protein